MDSFRKAELERVRLEEKEKWQREINLVQEQVRSGKMVYKT